MISSQYIKKLAENAGFDLCGITPCKHLAENESYFREWLAKGYGSSLEYLERNLDKRFDVRHLVEGAQTVVVCAVSYKNPLGEGYPPGCRTKIASYARNRDYHPVLKGMLGTMLEALRRQYPGLTGRTFVDTAPLLEKQLAVEAGLGWIGRQSLLLTPQYGSYVLLGELVLTLPSDQYDAPSCVIAGSAAVAAPCSAASHFSRLTASGIDAFAGLVDGSTSHVRPSSSPLLKRQNSLNAACPLNSSRSISGYSANSAAKSFGIASLMSESRLPSRAQLSAASHSPTPCASSSPVLMP